MPQGRYTEAEARRCQTKSNQSPKCGELGISSRKLAPFGQCDSAALFEDIAAVEVAILVEDPMG